MTELVGATPRGPERTPLELTGERECEQLAESLPGFELEPPPRTLRDGDVLALVYSWQPGGGSRLHEVRLLGSGGARATLRLSGAPADQEIDAIGEVLAAFAFGEPRMPARAYSTPELTALAELLGGTSFPGTGRHAFPSDAARLDARRALVARGVLEPRSPGRFAMDPADHAMVSVALDPVGVVRVAHRRSRREARSQFYVGSRLTVAQSSVPFGVHRLEPLPSGLLAAALLQVARLVERPAPERDPITLRADDFARLRDPFQRARSVDDPPAAVRLLSGVLTSTQLEAATDGATGPDTVAWLDAGDALGLWTVAREDERVGLDPVSPREICARVERLARTTCAPAA